MRNKNLLKQFFKFFNISHDLQVSFYYIFQ